jgi:hypothetical protein
VGRVEKLLQPIEATADNPQATALHKARSAFVHAARLRHGFGSGRLNEVARQHGDILVAIAARNTLARDSECTTTPGTGCQEPRDNVLGDMLSASPSRFVPGSDR